MKIHILRVLVLLVSISAASVLVWNATRDQKPKQTRKDDVVSPSSMQGSSKQKAVVDSEMIFEFEQETFVYEVTDEEVKRTRDAMLSTSKSGIIMSDNQIRKMLDERKMEELKFKKEPKLMPSSKSIDSILKPKDVEEIIEGSEPEKKKAPLMHSSKSLGGSLLTPEELEKMIEGVKQDPNAEQGSSPEVDPFAPSEERAK